MGMFDLGVTTDVKESGKVLQPGIYNAKFISVELGSLTSQKDGQTYKTMKLSLDIDGYGEWSHNFFEPKSAERTTGTFGDNPSPVEHFMISIRQIVDALNPKIGEDIDNDTITVKGKHISKNGLSFDQLVKLIGVLTEPYKGTEVEIKLVPQSNGFAAIPGFPAKISRTGALSIATRFIGHDLVFNQSEQKKIDAAKNAQPTNMTQTGTGEYKNANEVKIALTQALEGLFYNYMIDLFFLLSDSIIIICNCYCGGLGWGCYFLGL